MAIEFLCFISFLRIYRLFEATSKGTCPFRSPFTVLAAAGA